ncbi:MAG: hypothetical protein ACRDCG_00215 [Mycoplasmoidaceae bacterium]
MEEKKYSKAEQIIIEQLNILTYDDRTNFMFEEDLFLKQIIKNISYLREIELLTSEKSESLFSYKSIDKINSKIKNKQHFVNVKMPDSEIELIDEIHYLDSLSINIFGKNLFEFKKLLEENNLPLTSSKEPKKEEPSYNYNSSASNSKDKYNYGNPEDLKNRMISEMAMKRLMTEIRSGQIYIYLSKPKSVPILKYLVTAFYFLIALINLAFIILMFYITISKQTYNVFILNGNIVASGTPNANQANLYSQVSEFSNFIFPVLFVIIFPFLAKWNIKGMKNNENNKYTMNIFVLVIFTIIGIFNLITSLSFNPFTNYDNAKLYPADPSQNPNNLDFYYATLIFSLILGSLTSLGIVFLIPYFSVKPKFNFELQQELIQKYQSEIRKLKEFQ